MFGTWKIRRLNQSRFKVAPKAKFSPAQPFQIETGVPN